MPVDSLRIQYLEQQNALYEQLKPSLLAQYQGQFIAFENGRVLDADRDEQKLAQRVYQAYGYRDLLIKQVLLKEPQLSIASAMQQLGAII
jgi:hypothetical protein